MKRRGRVQPEKTDEEKEAIRKRRNATIGGMLWALNNRPQMLRVAELSDVTYRTALPRRIGGRNCATVTIRATPEIIESLQGDDAAERWRVLLIAIPQDAIDAVESPIVRSDEV